MIDTDLPVALTLASGVERMFPTLTPAQVKRIDSDIATCRARSACPPGGKHLRVGCVVKEASASESPIVRRLDPINTAFVLIPASPYPRTPLVQVVHQLFNNSRLSPTGVPG